MESIGMSRLYANEVRSRNYSYGGFLLLNIILFLNSFIPLRRNVLDFWGRLEPDKCAKDDEQVVAFILYSFQCLMYFYRV